MAKELPQGFVGKGKLQNEKIMLFGEEYDTLHQIAIEYGITPQTLKRRVEFVSLEEAVSVPKGTRVRKKK